MDSSSQSSVKGQTKLVKSESTKLKKKSKEKEKGKVIDSLMTKL